MGPADRRGLIGPDRDPELFGKQSSQSGDWKR
jgi:hypothetical protein